MGIIYHDPDRIFKLDTPNNSYLIGVVDEENFLGHIYYGKKISDYDVAYLLRTQESPFIPSRNNRNRISFLDAFPMEYSTHGIGDYREGALRIRTKGGHKACTLSYISHEIYAGKKKLPGLPASFAKEGQCSTLEITCQDKALGLIVVLVYSVFEDVDVIARHVEICNKGQQELFIEKAASMSLDMDNRNFDVLTLHGSWARNAIR